MSAKLTLLFLLLYPAVLFSQEPGVSAINPSSLNRALAVYHQLYNDQAPIYSGPQYIRFPYPIQAGHPFFGSNNPVTGSLVYDGVRYDSVQLLYDEIRDQLVGTDLNHTTLIGLYKGKVSWFSILGHEFVRLEKDSSQKLPDLGFCQLLYNGTIKVYKKEIKTINTRADNSQSLTRIIATNDFYYIRDQKALHEITNSRSLLAVFGDRKKELNQYLRSNRLKFRKNKDLVIVKAALYIEQSKK